MIPSRTSWTGRCSHERRRDCRQLAGSIVESLCKGSRAVGKIGGRVRKCLNSENPEIDGGPIVACCLLQICKT